MKTEKRKWISIAAAAAEGTRSKKKVTASGYQKMVAMAVAQGIETTRVLYQAGGLWHDILTHEGTEYNMFNTIDSGYMREVGSPRVAQEGIYVAIPENAEVIEVKIATKKEKELEGTFHLVPAPKPVLEGEKPEYIPNKKIYESDDLFPGRNFNFVGTKRIGGRKVAHILIYLFQYKPKSGKIIALESLELEIRYEKKMGIVSTPVRRTGRKTHVETLVLDSDSAFAAGAGKASPGGTGAEKLKDPDNEANFVIITTDDLVDSFSGYIAAKGSTYQVKIVTLTEILEEFPDKMQPKAIRDFLEYAVNNWNIPPEWVVLGGDTDKIPTHIGFNDGVTFSCDQYYSDLTGDMCPDISVSRFPASTPGDMKKICDLAASYNSYSGDWRNRVLFTAYQNSEGCNYIQCKNDIAGAIGSLEVIKRYAGEATKEEVIETIDAGVGLINYRGHGEATKWSASNGLTISDIPELTDDKMPPQVLSICCWNNQLDYPGCFGVTWIKEGKAITFLGASRATYTDSNDQFDKYLWDGIVNQGLKMAGDIFNWGTTKLQLNNPGAETTQNIYLYLLLGDPTAAYTDVQQSAKAK